MAYLERNGARIYYEVMGEGTGFPVTLVNGFTRSSTDFRNMGHHLTQLGFRAIALDNRGAGKTECPMNFSVRDSVEDILGIWDVLGVRESHLLGVSYGGLLAMNLTLGAQARVKSLTLISSTANSAYLKLDPETAGKTETEQSMIRYFSPNFVKGHKILVRSLAKEMFKAFQDPERQLRNQAQRSAMGAFNLTSALSEIRVPTLIIHGSDDLVVDIGGAGDMARQIPQARFEVFDGNGHLLMAEAPKRLYDVVGKFVNEIETTKGA